MVKQSILRERPKSVMWNSHLHEILLCLSAKPHYSIQLLDQILTQTITSGHTLATSTRNYLIRAYSKSLIPVKSILVHRHSIKAGSFRPDHYTYPALINASSRLYTASTGKSLHAHVVKIGLEDDLHVRNALIHFYGFKRNGSDAHLLFDTMPERDVASWNSLMSVWSSHGLLDEVLLLFKRLIRECVPADRISLASVLSACANLGEAEYGRSVHGYGIKVGLDCLLNVSNALLDMYIKCRQMGAASVVFDDMGSERDVVSYSILINGYVEMGFVESARDVFDQIVGKDRVIWNLMMHSYVKGQRAEEALELFKAMYNEGLMPDENTMVSVLRACTSLSDLRFGRLVHQFMNRNGIVQDLFVKTALIDMYSKCGSLDEALITFYKMEDRDAYAWTTMIEGIANNGYGHEALRMFNLMREQGIQPNEATVVSVLSACSHSGLVSEGCQLFENMIGTYKLQPKIVHFGCIVDLLSRAGLLHQAEEFIEMLLPEERLVAYKTLLSACTKHSEFQLGHKVANEIKKFSQSHETHVLVSYFHALAGQWTEVPTTRSIIDGLDTRKEPGISYVEL